MSPTAYATPNGTTPVRLVLADDHTLFRNSFKTLLNQQPSLCVVAAAANGQELLQQVEKHQPDVVITDIHMPVMNGLEATRLLTHQFPQIPVLALSMSDQETMIQAMLDAGAKGYLLKNAEEHEMLTAISKVRRNQRFYCSGTASKLLQSRHASGMVGEGRAGSFSEKEIGIMHLMCQEFSSKEIASHLHMNTRAVETARAKLQEKTGARNMVGIALFAIKNGFFHMNDINSKDNFENCLV